MKKEDSQLFKFCERMAGHRDDEVETPEVAAISRYLRQCDELDKRAQALEEIRARERQELEEKQRREENVKDRLSLLK